MFQFKKQADVCFCSKHSHKTTKAAHKSIVSTHCLLHATFSKGVTMHITIVNDRTFADNVLIYIGLLEPYVWPNEIIYPTVNNNTKELYLLLTVKLCNIMTYFTTLKIVYVYYTYICLQYDLRVLGICVSNTVLWHLIKIELKLIGNLLKCRL